MKSSDVRGAVGYSGLRGQYEAAAWTRSTTPDGNGTACVRSGKNVDDDDDDSKKSDGRGDGRISSAASSSSPPPTRWRLRLVFSTFAFISAGLLLFFWVGGEMYLLSISDLIALTWSSAKLAVSPGSNSSLDFYNRLYDRQLSRAREGKLDVDDEAVYRSAKATLAHAAADQLHGPFLVVGDDGDSLWRARPPPPPSFDVSAELVAQGGFNIRLSDSLPLDRAAPDSRVAQCDLQSFFLSLDDASLLRPASVVIVFHNEPFSTLFRSVHTVLNRTPPHLLGEIVLVDDGSTDDHIRVDGSGLVERYAAALPKTRLVRNPRRTGIVGARLLGIEKSRFETFVILDSHVEVQTRWLEPLLWRLLEHPKAMIMPQVDAVEARTFQHRSHGIGCTLGIIWRLMEHGFNPDGSNPKRRISRPWEYQYSPAMAGGLFAARKDFFMDIGGYDRGMTYWGVENLELSFRLWQCGGTLECAPCSRVYHIFREGGAKYSVPPFSLAVNKMRVISVWMDDYADVVWNVIGSPNLSPGDISDRLRLREELKCENFQWYLDNVWPESPLRDLRKDLPYMGPLVRRAGGLCLSPNGTEPDKQAGRMWACEASNLLLRWMYFARPKNVMPVLNDEACLDDSGHIDWCRASRVDQRWTYTEAGQLKNDWSQRCLSNDEETQQVITVDCDSSNAKQLWDWEAYNPPSPWVPPSGQ